MMIFKRVIFTLLLGLALAARARAGVPVAPLEKFLASPLGWKLVTETPEGVRVAESLLGRRLEARTDVRDLVARLEGANPAFAEEFWTRVRIVQEEATRPEQIPALARLYLATEAGAQGMSFVTMPAGAGAFLAPALPLEREAHELGLIPFRRIPLTWRQGQPRELVLRQAFGPAETLFLGLSSQGDYSFVLGTRAYVGQIFADPVIKGGSTLALKRGLILKFDDLPTSVVMNLKTELDASPQAVNICCVNGVCAALGRAGLHLGGAPGEELPLYRSHALERIVKAGFGLPDGRPAAFDIYVNSEETFGEFFQRYRRLDRVTQHEFDKQTSVARADIARVNADNIDQVIGHTDPLTRRRILTLLKGGVPAAVIMLLPATPGKPGDAP